MKKEIFTQDEIESLLAIVDEAEEAEETSDTKLFDFKRPHFLLKEDKHNIKSFFEGMENSIIDWVGHDLKSISLHSADYLSYSEFITCATDLAEHYIEGYCKNTEINLNTNIVLGIDNTLLIGLNGDPGINIKTGISEFNELKIAEGIVAFLEDNNIIDAGNIISKNKDYKGKQFPGYHPGVVLMYEIITKNQHSGLIYVFIPFEIIKCKIEDIKEKVKETEYQNKTQTLLLTAKLGEVEISMEDLKKCDTLFLNRKANEPIELYSGNTKVCEGEVIVKEDDTLGIIITKKGK